MPSKPAFLAMANFSSRVAPALIIPGMIDFLGFSCRGFAPAIDSAFASTTVDMDVARNSRRFTLSPSLFEKLDQVRHPLLIDDLLETLGHQRQRRLHALLDAHLQDRVDLAALPPERHARRVLLGDQ